MRDYRILRDGDVINQFSVEPEAVIPIINKLDLYGDTLQIWSDSLIHENKWITIKSISVRPQVNIAEAPKMKRIVGSLNKDAAAILKEEARRRGINASEMYRLAILESYNNELLDSFPNKEVYHYTAKHFPLWCHKLDKEACENKTRHYHEDNYYSQDIHTQIPTDVALHIKRWAKSTRVVVNQGYTSRFMYQMALMEMVMKLQKGQPPSCCV